jgi:hypothetical protein
MKKTRKFVKPRAQKMVKTVKMAKTVKMVKDMYEKEKVIIKKTPLLPGIISRCHPKYDGTGVGTRPGGSCIPAPYRRRVYNARTQKACGGKDKKERCLLKHSTELTEEEKKKILKDHFRPAMPAEWVSDPDMWLASTDIEAVMRQYEEAVPSFKFLGVVPIDFSAPDPYQEEVKDPYEIEKVAGQGTPSQGTPSQGPSESLVQGGAAAAARKQRCLADEFCTVDLKKELTAGIRTIGAVFNLDPHDKNGSHWIACCILLDTKAIYYFDSYGLPPPAQVSRFMRSFILQDAGLTLKYNGRRFQFGNSECGMYCMYFLICMINRVPFKTFVRHTVPDKYMLELRGVLFSQ